MGNHQAQAPAVITLIDSQGQEWPYIPFGERLPLFLKDYPPLEGWAVTHDARQAYPDRDPTLWVFQASLENPEGRIVATASALRRVSEYKDFEIGETAAYQRLITYLGYPGDPEVWGFEKADTPQAITPEGQATAAESTPVEAVAVVPTQTPETGVLDFPSPPEETAAAPDAATEDSAGSTIESPPPAPPATASTAPSDVPRGFVRRIEVLAKKKGLKEIPAYGNFAEAKQVLADLQAM
ncbi:hypothetical protein [Thiolapillus sp.]|uniref:hypothetical protein n=2 Tax=Thiolapillus sp. TaxID=2017437 RepID=UPI003AF42621